MAKTNLSFNYNADSKLYESNAVTMSSSSALIHLEFEDGHGFFDVLRSSDGEFVQADKVRNPGKVFDATIIGGGVGLKLKIACSEEPSGNNSITV